MKRIRINCQTEQGKALAELSKRSTVSIDKLGRMAIDRGLPLLAGDVAGFLPPVALPKQMPTRWVLREACGLFAGLYRYRIVLVPAESATVFDVNDNPEIKLKFYSAVTGGTFTIEAAQ